MINLILVVALLFLLFLEHKFKKKIFDFGIYIVLFFVCFNSSKLPDMDNYKSFYDAIGQKSYSSFLGYGWLVLCMLGNFFGVNYYFFKSILYCLSCVLIVNSIKKISSKWELSFFLYLIFPGLLDLIQIRYFLATSVILFFLIIAIRKNKAIDWILYLIALLISSTIHTSCLFYSIFLFLPVIKLIKYKDIEIVEILIIFIFVLLLPWLRQIMLYIFPSQQERINLYFSNGIISPIAMLIYTMLLYFQYIITKEFVKKSNYNDLNKYLILIQLLLLLSLPFVFVSSDFMRLQRPFLIINYALASNGFYDNRIKLPLILKKIRFDFLFYVNHIAYFMLFLIIFNYNSIALFFHFN